MQNKNLSISIHKIKDSVLHLESSFIISLLIGLAFVFLSGTFVLGDYQGKGGDFGQYFIHSQNILKGRSWSTFMEGYPAVLQGYPLLLTFISALFGNSVFYVGLLNSILWASCCVLAFHIYRDRFMHPLMGYAFLVLCLMSPYVFFFQQEGVPNIFYCFAFFTAYMGTKNLTQNKHIILSVFLILLAATIRIDSVIIYIAILIYFLTTKASRYLWVPFTGIVLTLGLDFFTSIIFDMKSNVGFGSSIVAGEAGDDTSKLKSMQNFISLLSHYLIGTFLTIPDLFLTEWASVKTYFTIEAANGYKAKISIFNLIICTFFAVAFLNIKKCFCRADDHSGLLSFDRLLFMGHLFFVSLVFLNVTALRYLLPIWPIFVFFTLSGIERLWHLLKLNQLLIAIFISSFVAYSGFNIFHETKDRPRIKNFLFAKDTGLAVERVASIKGNRPVGMFKPRSLTGLLDRKDAVTSASRGVRVPSQLKTLMAEDGIFLAYSPQVRAPLKDYIKDREDICITWKLNVFEIYEVKSDERTCIIKDK